MEKIEWRNEKRITVKDGKTYAPISELKLWDKNPRKANKNQLRGLALGWGWNKGKGMSPKEKAVARQMAIKKHNSKPGTKERIRRWHLEHPDRVQEIKQKYANSERGMEVRRAIGQQRLAREHNLRIPIDWDYWRYLCGTLDYHCQGCHEKLPPAKITVDHILPISRGGDNDAWNLQPLCKHCNSMKQNRLLFVDNVYVDLAYGDWLLKCQK